MVEHDLMHLSATADFIDDMDDQIEYLIDRTTLREVVFTLAMVCTEKAEHLRANWQDDRSAHAWDNAASRLSKLGATFGM
jgi:aspartate/glutamate racemase